MYSRNNLAFSLTVMWRQVSPPCFTFRATTSMFPAHQNMRSSSLNYHTIQRYRQVTSFCNNLYPFKSQVIRIPHEEYLFIVLDGGHVCFVMWKSEGMVERMFSESKWEKVLSVFGCVIITILIYCILIHFFGFSVILAWNTGTRFVLSCITFYFALLLRHIWHY